MALCSRLVLRRQLCDTAMALPKWLGAPFPNESGGRVRNIEEYPYHISICYMRDIWFEWHRCYCSPVHICGRRPAMNQPEGSTIAPHIGFTRRRSMNAGKISVGRRAGTFKDSGCALDVAQLAKTWFPSLHKMKHLRNRFALVGNTNVAQNTSVDTLKKMRQAACSLGMASHVLCMPGVM